MEQLYRLVYASNAKVNLGTTGINPEVSRILLKSKNNNTKLKIAGVLYHADGYFFQVLEGEKSKVSYLFNKISADTRHSDVRILTQGFIEQSQFSKWSMHFVAAHSSIRQLLGDNNFNQFEPFTTPLPIIEKIITVLSNNGVYEPNARNKTGILTNIKLFFMKDKTV